MAYFNNAATTYPKPASVYAAMDTFYRQNAGSIGRGGKGEYARRLPPRNADGGVPGGG